MAATKDFLGRGWRHPLLLDAERGRIALGEQLDKVKQSMRLVLATSPGERLMRPEFGCGVHELVFESLDATTLGRVESSVREALQRWEPRIDLLGVHASVVDALQGKLSVAVDFRLRSVNRRDNLVYDFYLGERA